MAIDPKRLAVGRLAQHLADGYYSFLTAHYVAVNPVSINALPPVTAKVIGQNPVTVVGHAPTGEIKRKDGTVHTIDLRHYLDLLREDQSLQDRFIRNWAIAALLTLGDELNNKNNGYFDQAPILELVYHLRNGVAHGNRFNITRQGRERLSKYPAHNREAAVRSTLGTVFEITPDLTGPVLFDFIGAADVIDVLQSVEIHLSQ
jgi:hypothetical protein